MKEIKGKSKTYHTILFLGNSQWHCNLNGNLLNLVFENSSLFVRGGAEEIHFLTFVYRWTFLSAGKTTPRTGMSRVLV